MSGIQTKFQAPSLNGYPDILDIILYRWNAGSYTKSWFTHDVALICSYITGLQSKVFILIYEIAEVRRVQYYHQKNNPLAFSVTYGKSIVQ